MQCHRMTNTTTRRWIALVSLVIGAGASFLLRHPSEASIREVVVQRGQSYATTLPELQGLQRSAPASPGGAPEAAVDPASQGPAIVTVRVVDGESGQGLAQARVTAVRDTVAARGGVVPPEDVLAAATTDGAGRASVHVARDVGNALLLAYAPSHAWASASLDGSALAAGAADVELTLRTALQIRGAVRTPGGEPVQGVSVGAIHWSSVLAAPETESQDGRVLWGPSAVTASVTNQSGEFDIEGLESGRYTLYVMGQDWVEIDATGRVGVVNGVPATAGAPERATIVVGAVRGARLRAVRRPRGTPVVAGHFRLSYLRNPGAELPVEVPVVRSGSSVIRSTTAGEFHGEATALFAFTEGAPPARATLVLSLDPETVFDVDVALRPLSEILGGQVEVLEIGSDVDPAQGGIRVRLARGEPEVSYYTGTSPKVVLEGGSQRRLIPGQYLDRDTVQFVDVPPGSWLARFHIGGRFLPEMPLTVVEGVAQDISLDPGRPSGIVIRLFGPDGRRVYNGDVSIRDGRLPQGRVPKVGPSWLTEFRNIDGRAAENLYALPAGPYVVTGRKPGFGGGVIAVDVREGEVTHADIRLK